MRISNVLKLVFLIAALSVSMLSAQFVLAGEERRAPPRARTSGTLGTQVMRAITQIQEMMTPEDPDDTPDLEGAKRELDELRERRFERMNDFEKSTLLNFYTNYYYTTEDYPSAILTLEEVLIIETLREDIRMRTLRSLGQLYMAEEDFADSIRNYQLWRDLSLEEDDIVFRGLSYAHYQLEQFAEALPFWLSYMDLLLVEGEELGRDDYSYLNGLYFVLEDFPKALELTKTMIILFDNTTDWQNLSAIYSSLDDEERRVQSLDLYFQRGMMDDETRFLNLSQSLAGLDVPYTGSKMLQGAMDDGFVEGDVDNYTVLTQMHLMASEFEGALAPAMLVADMDETGEGYDTLGYIHYVRNDYQDAADAFELAIEKGDLSNRSDTLMFLARAYLELREFDAAKEAATDASDAGNERARQSAQDFIRAIDGRRLYYATISERKEEAIDFYTSYPSPL